MNYPETSPDFMKAGMTSDLIYGVKNNIRVASEVMTIFSMISNIKNTVQKQLISQKWIDIADNCIYSLVNDERIIALISDSMKLQHITVIQPLLDLLGNIVSSTDSNIECELIKIPQFKDMLKF